MTAKRFDSADILFSSGCFADRKELVEYMILDEMAQKDEPIGSSRLKMALQTKGVNISEANVGRILLQLDSVGYTCLQKTQGRLISAEGRDYAGRKKDLIIRKQLQDDYMNTVVPHNLEDLVALLRVRRLLESEAASLAAHNALPEDHDALRQNLYHHKQSVLVRGPVSTLGMDFHHKVAAASRNRFIIVPLSILLNEEAAMEVRYPKLDTRELGECYNMEHQAIYEAILRRDSDEAGKQMYDHITSLIRSVRQQMGTDQGRE